MVNNFEISHYLLILLATSYAQSYRSNRWQIFFKTGVLKNFSIFTGKQLYWSLLLRTDVYRTPLAAASDHNLKQICLRCHLLHFLTIFRNIQIGYHSPHKLYTLEKNLRKNTMKSFEIESSLSFSVKSNKGVSLDSKNKKWIKTTTVLQNTSNINTNYTLKQFNENVSTQKYSRKLN